MTLSMDDTVPGLQLTADDIAFGFVAGAVAEPLRALPRPTTTPVAALAAAIRPALERPPCVVGFSGGRDSSLLLAVAVAEARRAGLPLPLAATLEFDSEATREREWQELVLTHLGLREWIRLPQGDELDFLGPVATEGLRRHGVLYPGNAHMVVPLADAARGGSVVTGFAGDDVLGGWPFEPVAALLARRRPPRRGDLRRLLACAAPAPFRTERYARGRRWVSLPWLRPPHRERAARIIAADMAGSPRTWRARMGWLGQRRLWQVSLRAMGLLAGAREATVHAPLLHPGFLAALGAAGGRLGIGDRTAVMRAVSADLLPAAIVERATKAEFSEPYFGPYTKRFATEWDGRGVDPAIVDAEALRAMWLSPHPHGLSTALLQSAWLAARSGADPAVEVER